MTEYKARCMRCQKEVLVSNPEITEINGKGNSKRKAVKGKCETCGTTVFKILKKE